MELNGAHVLFGRLLERQNVMIGQLDRIERRLQTGDARMTHIERRVETVERKADQAPRRLGGLPLWQLAAMAAVSLLSTVGILEPEAARAALGLLVAR